MSNLDLDTKEISNTWNNISSAKTNLLLNELVFKWPKIVLLAFFYPLLFDFFNLISFKKASARFKEGELLLFWIPWSICGSKLVKNVFKFLTGTATSVSFKCSILLFTYLFDLMLFFRISGIPFCTTYFL